MKFERFVKKPVVVDVIQYQGVRIECLQNDMRINWDTPPDAISINTVDGIETCHKGDYIIRGNQGELYTCPSSVFETDYERAPQRKRRTQKEDSCKVENNDVKNVFETEDEES
jgi:hypothetical protein